MQYNSQEIFEALQKEELVLVGCKEDLPFKYSQVQAASVDLRLDNRFVRFLPGVDCVDIKDNTNVSYLESKTEEIFLDKNEPIILKPHEIVFAQVYESISLGNCMAGRIEGRSRVARLGITVHCTGSYINPGYYGVMPLQIINHNNFDVKIYPYIGICQLILFHLNNPPLIEYGSNNYYQGESKPRLSNLSHSDSKNAIEIIHEGKIERLLNAYSENHKFEKGMSLVDKDSICHQKEIRDSIKKFIVSNYSSLCDMKKRLSYDLTKMEKESTNKKEFQNELKKCEILLLTASHIEDAVLTYFLYQQNKRKALMKNALYGHQIQIGKIGSKQIAHISQNDIGTQSAETAVRKALKLFSPKLIISIGIAYGADCKEQEIGDVLVSEKIIDVDKKNKLTNGKYKLFPNSILCSDSQIYASWGHYLSAKNHMNKYNWYWGTLLSKGTVLSDVKEKTRLFEAAKELGETNIIGGEMEGAGITRVCDESSIASKWLVIKGICDWGEQKNDLDQIAVELNLDEDNETLKDSIQALAAYNAYSSLKELIKKSPSAIDGL